MAKRNIVIEPDPILRKKSEKLEKVNLQTQKFLHLSKKVGLNLVKF